MTTAAPVERRTSRLNEVSTDEMATRSFQVDRWNRWIDGVTTNTTVLPQNGGTPEQWVDQSES